MVGESRQNGDVDLHKSTKAQERRSRGGWQGVGGWAKQGGTERSLRRPGLHPSCTWRAAASHPPAAPGGAAPRASPRPATPAAPACLPCESACPPGGAVPRASCHAWSRQTGRRCRSPLIAPGPGWRRGPPRFPRRTRQSCRCCGAAARVGGWVVGGVGGWGGGGVCGGWWVGWGWWWWWGGGQGKRLGGRQRGRAAGKQQGRPPLHAPSLRPARPPTST